MRSQPRPIPHTVRLISYVIIIALLATILPASGVFAKEKKTPNGMYAGTYPYNFYFAEGCTRKGFTEYLTLSNPSSANADIEVTYLFPSRQGFSKDYLLQAGSRRTLNVNEELGFSEEDVSMIVRSASPFVAERPMYFNFSGYFDGTDLVGLTSPRTSFYFAEGTTRSGFEEWLCLMNPNEEEARVKATFLDSTGAPTERELTVSPYSRQTLRVSEVTGPEKDVSAVVQSDKPVACERVQYFSFRGFSGGHVSSGVSEPTTSFGLAEGTTRCGYEEWLTLLNPSFEPADATLTYMFPDGNAQVVHHTIPPASRYTINAASDVGLEKDVSCFISSEIPLVGERPMYFNTGKYQGGHVGVGLPTSSKTFFFAEGTTQEGFDEYLCVENPDAKPTHARIDYLVDGSANRFQELDLPPRSRTTIPIHAILGRGTDHGLVLTAEKPVLAERPIYYYRTDIQGGDISGGLASQGPSAFSITPASLEIQPGESSQFASDVRDVCGYPVPSTVTWGIDGGIGTIEQNGLFTAGGSDSAGNIWARAWNLNSNAAVTVGNGPTFLAASIDSPEEGSFQRSVFEIKGTASGSSFASYDLSYTPASSPTSFTTIKRSEAPVQGSPLASWDTTGIPDGSYILRLIVHPAKGSPQEARRNVTIDNTAPTASIDTPIGTELLTGEVALTGTAQDANIESYALQENDEETGLLCHFDGSPLDALDGSVPRNASIEGYEGGPFNQGVRLGEDSYLDFDTAGHIDKDQGTVEFWVKPGWNPDEPEARVLFATSHPEGQGGNAIVLYAVPDTLYFGAVNEDGGYRLVGYPLDENELMPGNWSHVAATWNRGELNVFLNGRPPASPILVDAGSGVLSEVGQIMMLNWYPSVSGGADFVADELAVFKQVRTPEEIADDFNASTPRGPVDYASFSEVQGTDVAGGILGAWNTTGRADGSSSLRLVVTDKAGNSSTAVRRVSIDNQGPQVRLDRPEPGGSVWGTYQISGEAFDTSLDFYSVAYTSGAEPGVWHDIVVGERKWVCPGVLADWDVSGLPFGTYTLRLTATDGLGRTSEAMRETVVDNEPPVTSISSPSNDQVVSDQTDITGTANDLNFLDYSLECKPEGLAFLAHYDSDTTDAVSGNEGELSGSVSYEQARFGNGVKLANDSALSYAAEGVLDPEKGTVELWLKADDWPAKEGDVHPLFVTEPTDGQNMNMYAVAHMFLGGRHWLYFITNGESSTGGVMRELEQAEIAAPIHIAATWDSGTFKLYVNGRESDRTLYNPTTPSMLGGSFYVGGWKPPDQAETLANGAVDELSIWNHAKSGAEIVSDYETGLPGIASSTIASARMTPVENGLLESWDTTTVPNGTYQLSLTARQLGGFESSDQKTVRVDNDEPTASIESPTDMSSVGGIAKVTGTALDSFIDRYRIEYASSSVPGDWQAVSEVVGENRVSDLLATWDTRSLSEGPYLLRLTVTDLGGRASSETVNVSIENGLPTAQITSPVSGSSVGGTVNIEGTASDSSFRDYSVTAMPRGLALGSHFEADTSDFAGGPPGTAIGDPLYTEGKYAQGIHLDEGDCVGYSSPGAIGKDQGTFEAWIIPDWSGTDTDRHFILLAASPGFNTALSSNNGTLNFDVLNSTGQKSCVKYLHEGDISPGVPFHIAITWNRGEIHLYLNGEAEDQVDGFGTGEFAEGFPSFYLGGYPGEGGGSLEGTLDEAVFLDYDRSIADIERDCHARAARSAPLVVTDHVTNPVVSGVLGTFDSAILADRDYRLQLTCTDSFGNTSEAEALLTLDNDPPVAEIASPSESEVVEGTINISGSAWDEAFTSYRLEWGEGENPSSWNLIGEEHATLVYDGTLESWNTSSLSDGTYTIRLAVEGLSASQATRHIVLDSSAPILEITDPTDQELVSGATTVTGTATDPNFTNYKLEYASGTIAGPGGDWHEIASGTSPIVSGELGNWQTSTLPDEAYTLKLTAIDSLGHPNDTRRYVAVNNQPPTSQITDPLPQDKVSASERVRGTAKDEWFDSYTLYYAPGWVAHDPGDWIQIGSVHNDPVDGDLLETWDTTSVPQGRYTLMLKVVDKGGLESTSEAQVETTTLPSVDISDPRAGQVRHGTLEVRGTASNPDFLSYRLEFAPGNPPDDSPDWQQVGGEVFTSVEDGVLGSWDTGALASATYTLRLTVTGQFGHINRTRVTLVIDNTPPDAGITSPYPGILLAGSYQILGTANDEHKPTYYLAYEKTSQPGVWNPICPPHARSVVNGLLETFDTSLLDPGIYNLKLTVTDECSLESTAIVPFEIDSDNPMAGITSPSADAVLKGSVSVEGTAADPHFASYTLSYYSNDVPETVFAGPVTSPVEAGPLGTWNTSTLPDGVYNLHLHAEDTSGNPADHIISGVKVDNTDCTASITSPDPGVQQKMTGQIELKGTAADENFSRYTLEYATASDPGNWLPIGGDYLAQVDRGTLATWDSAAVSQDVCTLRLRVYDRAGHSAEAQTTLEVDNRDPDVIVTSPAIGTMQSGVLSVEGTAQDSNFDKAEILVASGPDPGEDDFEPLRTLPVSTSNAELATLDTGQQGDGTVTLKVKVSDKLGHLKETDVTFSVDNSLPEASITDPLPEAVLNGQLVIEGTAADANIDNFMVQYAAGDVPPPDGGWTNVEPPRSSSVRGGVLAVWDTAGLSDGPYIIRLFVTDRIGHTSSATVGVQLASDSGACAIVINNGAAFTSRREVTLTLSSPGAQRMCFSNDGDNWSNENEPYSTRRTWVLPDTQGSNTVYARFFDAQGQQTQGEDSINLDSIVPQDPLVTSPPDKSLLGSSVEVVAHCNDPLPSSGVKKTDFFYSVNGSPMASFGSDDTSDGEGNFSVTLDTSTIGYGYVDLFARFYDAAGNCNLSPPTKTRRFADEQWGRPGYESANTRFNSKFDSKVIFYKSDWELGGDDWQEQRMPPVAGVGQTGDVQYKRVYQIKKVFVQEWGHTVDTYIKVIGIDPDSGRAVWEYKSDDLRNYPITACDGYLYLVEGTKILRFNIGQESSTKVAYDMGGDIRSAPCYMGGGKAIVPLPNCLRGVDISDPGGGVSNLWTPIQVSGAQTPASSGSGTEQLIAYTCWGNFYIVKRQPGGDPVTIFSKAGGFSGTPVIVRDMVFAYGGGVHAFKVTGTTVIDNVWPKGGFSCDPGFACAYNMIYAITRDGQNYPYLEARDTATGSMVWSKKLEGFDPESQNCASVVTGAPAVGNGQVFLGAGQMASIMSSRSRTILYTLDAFSGEEQVQAVLGDTSGWSQTADNSVCLAFNSVILNWNSSGTWKLSPDNPEVTYRSANDYSGIFDEVNTANATFTFETEDFKVETRGAPLEFTRSYSSSHIADAYSKMAPEIPKDGPLGPGWSFNYGMRIELSDETRCGVTTQYLIDEHGNAIPFTFKAGQTKGTPPSGVFDTLEKVGDNYVLTRKDHTVYEFEKPPGKDCAARLISICNDPSRGDTNKTLLFYDDAEHPYRVTRIQEPYSDPDEPRTISISYFTTDKKAGKIQSVDGPGPLDIRFDYEYSGDICKVSTYTDPDDNTTRYEYRENAILNLNGIQYVKDPTGHSKYVHYEEDYVGGTNVLRVVDHCSVKAGGEHYNHVRYLYSSINKTTEIIDQDGHSSIQRHDGVERLLEEIDPEGGITTYSYDKDGMGRTMRDKNGRLTTYKMKMNGEKSTGDVSSVNSPSAGDPEGELGQNTTKYEYDDLGQVTKVTDARKGETKFVYGDPQVNPLEHRYDLMKKTDPCGFETTFIYGEQGFGKPTEVHQEMKVDGSDLRKTQLIYDEKGRKITELKWINDHWGLTIENLTYDDAGRVTVKRDGMGNIYRYEYDDSGRVKDEWGPLSFHNHFKYDTRGNKTSWTDSLGSVTTYEYDGLNRLTKTIYTVHDCYWDGEDPEENKHTYSEETEYSESGNVERKTDRNGNSTSFFYDGAGRVVRQQDPTGKSTRMAYDLNGNMIRRETDGYGTEVFTYDELNRLVAQSNAQGEETRFTYDLAGNKLSESRVLEGGFLATTDYQYDACNRVKEKREPFDLNWQRPTTTITYYGSGEKESVTDPENHVTRWKYDSAGRLASSVLDDHGVLHETAYLEYDGNSNPLQVRDPNHNVKRFAYDERNRLKETYIAFPEPEELISTAAYDEVGNKVTETLGTGAEQRLTRTSYDELNRPIKTARFFSGETYYWNISLLDGNGNRVETRDPRNILTRFTYDPLNRVLIKDEPGPSDDGEPRRLTRYVYDDSSRSLVVTDPKGNSTFTIADNLGRESYVRGPSGEERFTAYNMLGKPSSVSVRVDDQTFATTTNSYDFLGRLTEARDPNGHPTTYSYDRCGNKVTETDADQNTTTFTYNGMKQVTSRSEPYQEGATHTTTYAYDLNGNKAEEKDGMERAVDYYYDRLDRLTLARTNQSGPDETTTSYVYDTAGNLTSVRDGRENTVLTTTYDRLGRAKTESDAAGNTTRYEYDPCGNLTRSEDPEGRVVTRYYNQANLIRFLNAPEDETDTTYDYDQNLNYSYLTNNSGDYEISLSHDHSNRLETIASQLEGVPEFTYSQSFDYDRRGDATGIDLGYSKLAYSYDLAGNLTGALDSESQAAYTFSYTDSDRLNELTMPGGVNTSYDYFGNGLTRSITMTKPGAPDPVEIASFDYTYDSGNLPQSCDTYIEGNPASDLYRYQHDGAGRLRSSRSDSTSVEDLLYEYDRSGNMTKKTVSPDPVDPQKDQVTDYYYDADNRLTGDSEGTAYSYDRCGNLTQKGFMTYDYDSLDRMTLAVSVPNYFSFTYDPLSRMTLKTDNSGSEQYTWMLGTKDDPVRITGYSDDPQSFIRTPDGKRVLALYEDGILNSYGLNAHTDVSFAADRTGGITWSSLYRPFGEARYGTGSLLNPLGFQSDYTDFDTGLVDMGSRWYAPELSRFTTEDTADPRPTDPESYNPYLYADDAPIARIDPLGESWWNPWDWAKAAGRGVRKAGRGLFNFVIMPYFRSVSNAVNWVARTTSSLARGLGRGTMATLRGLGHGVVSTAQWGWRNAKAVGRGIGRGTAAAFRGLGHGIVSSAEWAGRNTKAVSRAITGGARWSDFLSEITKNYYNPVAIYKNYQQGKTRLPDWAEALCDATVIAGSAALTAAIGGEALASYLIPGYTGWFGGGAAVTAGSASAGGAEGANELVSGGEQAAGRLVIGKVADLTAPNVLEPGEYTLLERMSDQGSSHANWIQNSRLLRIEMNHGLPIRDATGINPLTGELAKNTGFLHAERYLLSNHGWAFDKGTSLWTPPQ